MSPTLGSRPELRLFLAVFLVACVFVSPIPRHNENRTLDLVRAMGEGRLSIDADAANTVDKAFVPSGVGAVTSGHYYSGGAPGLAFALLPAYVVARPVLSPQLLVLFLTVMGASLPLAVGAVGVRRAVLAGTGCSLETATLAASLHAFGTIALPFSTRLYAHSLTIALFAWALALILRAGRARAAGGTPAPLPGAAGGTPAPLPGAAGGTPAPLTGAAGGTPAPLSGLALAGLLAALAVVCDYNVALLAAALGVLAFLQGGIRGGVAFALGALPAALVLMGYQEACFGSPFDTPYDHHADRGTQSIVKASYGFSYPRPAILLQLLFGVRRGFFFTQPAVLVGLAGLVLLVKRSAVFKVALVAALVAILSNAARAHDWHAGSSYGARYCAAALPFLALGYPRVLDALGRGPRTALVVASFAAAGLGTCTDWGRSIFTNLDSLKVMGPRACGLASLLLRGSPDDATFGTALVGTLALAVSVPLAWKILRPRLRVEGLLALALGLWLVGAPGVTTGFMEGTLRVAVLRSEIAKGEIRRAIEGASSVEEARGLVGITSAMRDKELLILALDHLIDLDRDDAEARLLRERLR